VRQVGYLPQKYTKMHGPKKITNLNRILKVGYLPQKYTKMHGSKKIKNLNRMLKVGYLPQKYTKMHGTEKIKNLNRMLKDNARTHARTHTFILFLIPSQIQISVVSK